jgi:NAD(P)H-dependent FMN reductase
MPLFSVDIEEEIGKHPLAQKLLDKIAGADILVVSMAEHNGNYSASFKMFLTGVLEFRVSFSRKAMLLMASSPG